MNDSFMLYLFFHSIPGFVRQRAKKNDRRENWEIKVAHRLCIDGFGCAIMGTEKGIEIFRNIGYKRSGYIKGMESRNRPEYKQKLELGNGIGSYQTEIWCLNFASFLFLSLVRWTSMEKMEFFSISFPPRDDLSFAPSVYDRVRIGVLFSDGNLFSIFIARDLGCMASSYSPLEASSMRSSKLLSTVHARSLGGYIVLYVRLSFARERAKEIN